MVLITKINDLLFSFSSALNLFVPLQDVVLAQWTCRVHLKPFNYAGGVEMMITGESMEFRLILVQAKTYTTFLANKKKFEVLVTILSQIINRNSTMSIHIQERNLIMRIQTETRDPY